MTTRTTTTRRIAAVAGPVALGVLGAAASLLAAVAVEAQPRTPGRVAAVFPPWWSPSHVVGAAGSAGDVAGVGAAPFVVILRGDPADLSRRARSAGALLLLDPALAGACARPPARVSQEPVTR